MSWIFFKVPGLGRNLHFVSGDAGFLSLLDSGRFVGRVSLVPLDEVLNRWIVF